MRKRHAGEGRRQTMSHPRRSSQPGWLSVAVPRDHPVLYTAGHPNPIRRRGAGETEGTLGTERSCVSVGSNPSALAEIGQTCSRLGSEGARMLAGQVPSVVIPEIDSFSHYPLACLLRLFDNQIGIARYEENPLFNNDVHDPVWSRGNIGPGRIEKVLDRFTIGLHTGRIVIRIRPPLAPPLRSGGWGGSRVCATQSLGALVGFHAVNFHR
jgi:hypothetical protein